MLKVNVKLLLHLKGKQPSFTVSVFKFLFSLVSLLIFFFSLKSTTTIILFTHSDAMKNIADVVYTLDNGRLVK
jgi:hypothetical protein